MNESTESYCPATESLDSSVLDRLTPEQQVRLTEVLDRYLRGLENGLPDDPTVLIGRHPDLAEPLAAYLDNLARLHEMAAAFGQTPAAGAEPRRDDGEVRRLGDYLLVREVGRGGMGVVYEARQLSLDRRVALKVLPFAAVLESQQIARFKNEAQAAAQLHHPNIVPVFAVGVERGVHYYAMQFIDGQPLDRAIAALRGDERRRCHSAGSATTQPARETRETINAATRANEVDDRSFLSGKRTHRQEYFRTVVRLGIQAADALQAAHAYGIVHRDVKPSNLMVDAGGKLWITDFGLARCQTDRTLTRTGDVVGTRQYMSPEQAQGRGALVDQRTDIYSLGATLYELLTLEPARPAADQTPRPTEGHEPRRPRRLEPQLPADLETVVLKAMAEERDDRYLTAQELADDLRRVLDGQPTVARPPTLVDRAYRFARRHRRSVAAAAGLALLVMFGLGTSALLLNRERANTERNYLRAERHYRDAREAVDRFGSHMAERLADVPGAESFRRELLDETLAYYQRFVAEAEQDPALRADLALTYSKIGTLVEQTGSTDDAIAAHRKAIDILERLVADQPGEREHRRRLAAARNNLALSLRRAGRSDDARGQLEQAIALQRLLAAEHPSEAQYRLDLGLSHNNLGQVASETGEPALAGQSFREAIRLQEDAAGDDPPGPDVARDLAASYNNLAALVRDGDPAQAVSLHRRAADLQASVVKRDPQPKYQSAWALTLNNLGAAQARAEDLAGAVDTYRRAIELQKELLRLAPLDREFRFDLAVSYNNLGLAYTRLGQAENAERSFRNALGFERQLASEYPRDVELASSLGGVYNNLGIVQEEQGQVDQAAESYRQAIEYQSRARSQATSVDRYRDFLSKHYYNYGRVLRRLGRADGAAQAALARKKLWPHDPMRLLSVAEELALASALLDDEAPSGMSSEDCARLSIEALREAVAAGLTVPADLEQRESFARLRGRPDFAALVQP